MNCRQPRPRAGYTLVELLVVIAIITILIGLLLPAVQRVRMIGQRASASSDINQLAVATAAFEQRFRFYPPTTFNGGSTTDQDAFIRPMFRGSLSGYSNPGNLSGIQSLVYFLGGPNQTGWSNDSPTAPTATNKIPPFYDFPSNRMNGLNFLDPWGSPYGYIATNAQKTYPAGAITITTAAGNFSILAYTSGNRPVNQNSFQIFSAGVNKRFGPGGAWQPGVTASYVGTGDGVDDMANFNNGTPLGGQGN